MFYKTLRKHIFAYPTTFLCLLGFLLCLPIIVFSDIPAPDSARYYIRMANEIATANWQHAFYPMIPPLLPFCGGVLSALLYIDAFTALKLFSALLFVATIIPLYYLFCDCFGQRIALWGSILYIFFPRLVRYVGLGITESGKIFFFVLMVYGLVRYWRSDKYWRYSGLVAFSAAGLALVRSEGIIFSIFGILSLFILVFYKAYKQKQSLLPTICKSLSIALIVLFFISPRLYSNWNTTGYTVLDTRQAFLLQAILEPFGYHSTLLPNIKYKPIAQWVMDQETLWIMILEMVKGFFPFYFIFALVVLLWRLASRKLTRIEVFLLMWCVGHTLFFFAGHLALNYSLSRRHIAAAAPFLLGWTAMGMIGISDYLQAHYKYQGKALLIFISILGSTVLIWDATKPVRSSQDPDKRNYLEISEDCGKWLKTEGRARVPDSFENLKTTTTKYHNGHKPVLLTANPYILLESGGDFVNLAFSNKRDPHNLNRTIKYSLSQLIDICQKKQIHFIISDELTRRAISFLERPKELPTAFKVVYDKWHDQGVLIIAYMPNLIR